MANVQAVAEIIASCLVSNRCIWQSERIGCGRSDKRHYIEWDHERAGDA
jgi:hypothetical protein